MSNDQKATIELLHRTVKELRESKSKLEDELNTAKNSLFLCNKNKRAAAIKRIRAAVEDNDK